MRLGQVSFWFDQMGGPGPARPPLAGAQRADVCIVGAGFTGLWTALYLKRAAPSLGIVVLERDFAGYGASGRNGGWLTGGFAWNHARYAAARGEAATRAMVAAMEGTVAGVMADARALGFADCIQPTDEMSIATNRAQEARMLAEFDHRRHWGETRLGLLDEAGMRARIDVADARGALVTSGVARIDPARMVRALAQSVEALGVTIHEQTEALAILPSRVETSHGTLRADIILRCTEGYSAGFSDARRSLLPLNSAQIVTDPLPAALWDRIGWQGAELLGDFAHMYAYAQRTPDGRIAMGGRGTPYRFGSRSDTDGQPDAATVRQLVARLHALFPATRDVRIAHAWCGVLGVPRDWCARVAFDATTGLGWAGGYVGVGVSTSWLAGRTLAELALGRDTDRTRLPFVNLPLRHWEPEPLRWLGVRGMYALMAAADRAEAKGGRATPLAAVAKRLMGRD
jgi:glycine/D-amino acid oxidase-like deaminating enzyme